MQLLLRPLVSIVPLENTAGSHPTVQFDKMIVPLDLNHLLGSPSVLRSLTELTVHPLNILMNPFPGAQHAQLENTVLMDFHSIVLLELFLMEILVEYVMLDLNVQMAKAKHHVLVKHTHLVVIISVTQRHLAMR